MLEIHHSGRERLNFEIFLDLFLLIFFYGPLTAPRTAFHTQTQEAKMAAMCELRANTTGRPLGAKNQLCYQSWPIVTKTTASSSSLFLDWNQDWGDVWYNGQHICFPSLPPMLQCGFESRLGLEFSGFGMWHFLTLVVRGFLRVLRFPPLLH